jgi:hypothetical protein
VTPPAGSARTGSVVVSNDIFIDAVIATHPGELTRDELAAAAGVSAASSSFSKHVSRLSSLGLVKYPGAGRVAAGPLLFPEGLS